MPCCGMILSASLCSEHEGRRGGGVAVRLEMVAASLSKTVMMRDYVRPVGQHVSLHFRSPVYIFSGRHSFVPRASTPRSTPALNKISIVGTSVRNCLEHGTVWIARLYKTLFFSLPHAFELSNAF